ncbi:MAG: hypothetical protein ACE5WD_07445 [Candidatus Aminicenantia bacterium]
MAKRILICILLFSFSFPLWSGPKIYWHLSINKVKNYTEDTCIIGIQAGLYGFRGRKSEWAWLSFVEIPGAQINANVPPFERRIGGNFKVYYLGFVRGAAWRDEGQLVCSDPSGYDGVRKIGWRESWADEIKAYGFIMYNLPTNMENPVYRIDDFCIFISPPQYLNAQGRMVQYVPTIVPLSGRRVDVPPYMVIYDSPFMDIITDEGTRSEVYDSLFKFAFQFDEYELPPESGKLWVKQPDEAEGEVWSWYFFRSNSPTHPQWKRKF